MGGLWDDILEELNDLIRDLKFKLITEEEIEESRMKLLNSIKRKKELIEDNRHFYWEDLENSGNKYTDYRELTNYRNELHDKIEEHSKMMRTADILINVLNRNDGLKHALKYYKEELEELGRFVV